MSNTRESRFSHRSEPDPRGERVRKHVHSSVLRLGVDRHEVPAQRLAVVASRRPRALCRVEVVATVPVGRPAAGTVVRSGGRRVLDDVARICERYTHMLSCFHEHCAACYFALPLYVWQTKPFFVAQFVFLQSPTAPLNAAISVHTLV